MGLDGAWTLLLSCTLMVGTLGLSWLAMLLHVWRVASQTPTQLIPKQWIVVLGKRLLGATVTLEYAARLRRAETLYKTAPGAQILVLGGHTSEGPFSEAQQGQNYLRQRGVPVGDIQLEDHSLHTLENLRNARDLLAGRLDQPLTLVTSRYHLARSQALATGLGLPHQLCAAEDELVWCPALCRHLVVESFFLHWYWVGRLWSTWTRNRKSLARIT